MQVVALDSSLKEKETWDLGSLNVWFKEGRYETNNQRMNENYFLKREIIAQFPPANEKEKNPIVSLTQSLFKRPHLTFFLTCSVLVLNGFHCGDRWVFWMVHDAAKLTLTKPEADGLLGHAHDRQCRRDPGRHHGLLVLSSKPNRYAVDVPIPDTNHPVHLQQRPGWQCKL